MNASKELWFGFNDEIDITILDKIFNLDYSVIFVHAASLPRLESVKFPAGKSIAVLVDDEKQYQLAKGAKGLGEKIKYFFTRDPKLLPKIDRSTASIGLFHHIGDKAGLLSAIEQASLVDVLLLEFKDITNIPLELVLARTQDSRTRIFKKVLTAQDGEVSLMTMERGSDGILLMSKSLKDIIALNESYQKFNKIKLNLKPAVVKRIEHTGMGDRVCIDTTSELFPDEGMILGSTSAGGIVVCSETHYLPYMNLRPFRVNAGGLHLYVNGPNNFNAYLSDLQAGSKVFVVNSKGEARTVTVGRVKIERRPLLLVVAEIEGTEINVFIQDDWHVRVMGSKGEIIPSAEVKIGDLLLGYLQEPGRHVGYKIDEKIVER
jgi:3-amino-4-hydroxybenzoic acid synthase